MGDKDSSLTRVQPVFNCLLNKWPSGEQWIETLCEMARRAHPGASVPTRIGSLLESEAPRDETSRMRKIYERLVPPPTAFLRWLLQHPDQLQVRPNDQTFGTTTENAREWRRRLLRGTRQEREEMQREGLAALERRKGPGSYRKRWAFEGFSHVDCCLISRNCVLFIEGKRTDSVSPSTRWFKQRSQLWRNVEAAEEFAAGKQFGVMLAVESEPDGTNALAAAGVTLAGSYPHLAPEQRANLAAHLLGFVTWPQIAREFGLPPSCLIESVSAQ